MPARVTYLSIRFALRWVVPIRYGVPVSEFLVLNNKPAPNSECLLVNTTNNAYIGSLTNCNAYHPSLTIYYDGGNSLTHRHCPTGWFSSRLLNQEQLCFNIAKNRRPKKVLRNTVLSSLCMEGSSMFVVNNAQRSHVFQELGNSTTDNDRCLFSLQPYQYNPVAHESWLQIGHTFSYVNWDINWMSTRLGNRTIMLNGLTGKWDYSPQYTCLACQYRSFAFSSKPRMSLELRKFENLLVLKIENEQSLWGSGTEHPEIKCFVRHSVTLEVYVANLFLQNKTCDYCSSEVQNTNYLIVLTPQHTLGPYWCVGFNLNRGEIIQSNSVIAYHITFDTFAVLLNSSSCLTDCSKAYLEGLFEHFLTREKMFTKFNMLIWQVTLMRREMFGNHQQQLVFHLLVSKNTGYYTTEANNLKMFDPDMLRVYTLHQMLLKILPILDGLSIFDFVLVNSVEFCVPASISVLQRLNWWAVRIGQISPSLEHYVCNLGMGAVRACVGNRLDGGSWFIYPGLEENCEPVSEATESLINLFNNFTEASQTTEVLHNVAQYLSINSVNRLPIDVFYVSEIMERVVDLRSSSIPVQLNQFLDIYNQILESNESILRISAVANTTNRLLGSWDCLTDDMTSFVLSSNGVRLIRTPKMIMAIIDPTVQNITGIGLFSSPGQDMNDLNEFMVRPLSQFQDENDLLIDSSLEIATFLPSRLLTRLSTQHGNIHKLVVTIFCNDNLFQAVRDSNGVRPRADGMVISMTMPGLDTHILPYPVSVFFRNNSATYSQGNVCSFWNYTLLNGWAQNGMRLTSIHDRNIQCTAMHLTHFGHLLYQTVQLTKYNERALDIITIVGCSLSLVGIAGIFLTGLMFPQWRTKVSTRLLLQFSAAIAIQIILFGLAQSDLNLGCIAMGAMQHYALLVVFLWKLIIAYMQFMRYVVVFNTIGTNRWLLKASMFGWCLPVLPVLVVLLVDPQLYVPIETSSTRHICYPRSYALYFGLLLPIGAVIVANLVVFITVLWSLLYPAKVVTVHKISAACSSERKTTLSQLRLSVFLFFLLGLSWFFGFLASSSKLGIMFSYLFCITATIHGFVLFLYFIILDPVARHLWLSFFRRLCCENTNTLK